MVSQKNGEGELCDEYQLSNLLFQSMVFRLIFFGSTRGVRQGDSLSPLLFDIVMEGLSHMLDAAAMLGQFLGFSVGNLAGTLLTVSHLLFADDTHIFCNANSHHLAALRGILARFEVVSGLKINLLQSELVPISNMLIWRN